MQVTREQGDLSYVGCVEQPSHEPFEAEREPAVRQHAVPHRVEVSRVCGQVRLATLRQGPDVVAVAMQPLAPTDQLEAAEDQVGGARVPGRSGSRWV